MRRSRYLSRTSASMAIPVPPPPPRKRADASLGKAFETYAFDMNRGAYDALVGAGKLDLIQDPEIMRVLREYYYLVNVLDHVPATDELSIRNATLEIGMEHGLSPGLMVDESTLTPRSRPRPLGSQRRFQSPVRGPDLPAQQGAEAEGRGTAPTARSENRTMISVRAVWNDGTSRRDLGPASASTADVRQQLRAVVACNVIGAFAASGLWSTGTRIVFCPEPGESQRALRLEAGSASGRLRAHEVRFRKR